MSSDSFFSRLKSFLAGNPPYRPEDNQVIELNERNVCLPVSYKGRCGYVTEEGKWVISPQFGRFSDFAANGLAVVKIAKNMVLLTSLAKS